MSNNSKNGGNRRTNQPARRRNNNNTPRTNGNGRGNGAARTPLLPVGVNNKATMPMSSQEYNVRGEEVISIINVAAGSTPGQIIYNQLIVPSSARRLGILSTAWQRIDWRQASLHLVALNGSLVQSGYTMGWIEDPEIVPPTASSDVIPFLTALRSTTVRQNWVESASGVQVATPDKPEMYTQQGSDVRRYSPGRLMIAVAGDVTTQATFQLMLRYNVRLYVPIALTVPAPPTIRAGYDAIVPAANNVAVSTTSIDYPGLPSGLAPGNTAITMQPIIGIERAAAGAVTNPSPPNYWRLFPTGTSVTIDSLTGTASFTVSGVTGTFQFSRLDMTGGQFRAFQPIVPTTTVTRYTAYSIAST